MDNKELTRKLIIGLFECKHGIDVVKKDKRNTKKDVINYLHMLEGAKNLVKFVLKTDVEIQGNTIIVGGRDLTGELTEEPPTIFYSYGNTISEMQISNVNRGNIGL